MRKSVKVSSTAHSFGKGARKLFEVSSPCDIPPARAVLQHGHGSRMPQETDARNPWVPVVARVFS